MATQYQTKGKDSIYNADSIDHGGWGGLCFPSWLRNTDARIQKDQNLLCIILSREKTALLHSEKSRTLTQNFVLQMDITYDDVGTWKWGYS